MNTMLQHKVINAKIKILYCYVIIILLCYKYYYVNTWPSRGKVIPCCIAVERLVETYPCPAKIQSPCARAMNAVQDDIEAWWQNLVKCLLVNYPCLLTAKLE